MPLDFCIPVPAGSTVSIFVWIQASPEIALPHMAGTPTMQPSLAAASSTPSLHAPDALRAPTSGTPTLTARQETHALQWGVYGVC